MRDFDYYVSNINLFTHPQLHLYPMLGVRQLISDVPTSNSEEFTLGGDIFFEGKEPPTPSFFQKHKNPNRPKREDWPG